MSVLVVDTSVWIDFLRGDPLPDLERALEEGMVVLSPIVVAELFSSPLPARKRAQLASMLRDLPLAPTAFDHWADVGELRARAQRAGLSVSTPDAHIAQCAIDAHGALWSRDKVFSAVAKHSMLKLFVG